MTPNDSSYSPTGPIGAVVNGREFRIHREGGRLTVDGAERKFSFQQLPDGRWYIREGYRGIHARILDRTADGKALTVSTGGRLLTIQLRDRLDELTARMNMHAAVASTAVRLVAPMPGLIKSVLVTGGQQVPAGEPVLVLEAMKMENLIRTSAEGSIGKVLVAPGDRVEKGQLLIEFN